MKLHYFLEILELGKHIVHSYWNASVARYGHKVYCTRVKRLTKKMSAKKENTLDQLFKKMLTSKLWILDDWGVVSMNHDANEEVFDLFDRRKHNSAMLLTSNRDVKEWLQVFSDPVLANQLLIGCLRLQIFDSLKEKVIA